MFLLLSMTALVLSLSSCQREERLSGDGTPQDVTISVAAPYSAQVKSDGNPGAGDLINRCILEIYEDGVLYGERQSVDFAGNASFKANLIAGHTYDFVFWADYAEGSAADGFQDVSYNTADGLTAITVITDGYTNNDDNRDAFFGSFNVTIENGNSYSYTLSRPFGRVQMFTTDLQSAESDLTGATVKVSFAQVPAGFNALSKTVSPERIEIVPAATAPIFGTPTADDTEAQLSYDYIFASENDGETLVNFSLDIEKDGQTLCSGFSADNIPVRQNYRTNVRGNFLSQSGTDVDIDVDVDPGFEDSDIDREIITDGLVLESSTAGEPTADGISIRYKYTYDGDGVITESGIGYRVKDAQSEYSYVAYAATRSTDSATVTLTGLEPATEYEYVCYFVLDGIEDRFLSTPGYFTTADEPESKYIPIADVRALFSGSNVTISEDWTICGTVISDYSRDGLNNATSARAVVIQDETAGIYLFCQGEYGYRKGDVIEVNVNGLTLQLYSGLLQLNGVPEENITVTATASVEPKTITAADLLTGKYESQYVAVPDVQVVESDLSKTFVENNQHTSINFESRTGEKFLVFSGKYSKNADEQVPQGSGTLMGIASINNGNYQISLTSTDDYAGLTGERFGSEQPEPEGKLIGDYNTWNSTGALASFMDDFSTVSSSNQEYHNDNWLFWTNDGSDVNFGFKTGTFNNNQDKYIQIAPFNSSLEEVVAYALPPRADMSQADPKTFTFSKALYYKDEDNSKLEVVVSTDFTGNFETATWTVVKDCSFPSGSDVNVWEDESIDMSQYASSSSLCIALRYTGKSNTYRIDNVGWGDTQSGGEDPETVLITGTAGDGVYTSNIDLTQSAIETDADWSSSKFEIDGTEYDGMKLGTSSRPGTFSFNLGKTGTATLTMYAIAWNDKPTHALVKITGGGTINGASEVELDCQSNTGLAGNPNPAFVITVGSNDFYTLNIEDATENTIITVTTEGMENDRIGFFGVNVK